MQFVFTEEQVLIQETARGFFAEHADGLRSAIDSDAGYDAALWATVTREMGFGGIAFPDQYGGSELGYVELAIVLMEMGRVLYASPFLPSLCMAAPAILHGGSEEDRARYLPSLISGESIATLAYTGASWEWRGVADAVLTPAGDGFVLEGSASFVPFAHIANLIVVVAQTAGGGLSLVALPSATAGLSIHRHGTMDLTRPLSTLRFDQIKLSRDAVLGEPGAADAAVAKVLDLARIALSAEQAGGAEAVLDLTVDYAKQRVQFGRTIGSFQAIKHRLADMMVKVETGKTAAFYAACAVDDAPGELAEAASIAKSYCSDAFFECAGDAIQLHGGIGFTWEHDAQLYFKRARASATMLGDGAWNRARIAQMIGLDTAIAPAAAAA